MEHRTVGHSKVAVETFGRRSLRHALILHRFAVTLLSRLYAEIVGAITGDRAIALGVPGAEFASKHPGVT